MNIRNTGILLTSLIIGGVLIAIMLLPLPWATAQHGEPTPQPTVQASDSHELDEECRSLARECYTLLSQPPGSDSILFFQCRTDVELRDTTFAGTSTNTVDISLNSDRVCVAGDEFLMVRDSSDLLFVMPRRKSIHLYSVAKDENAAEDVLGFMNARGELLASSLVSECVDEELENGERLRRVRFSPDPARRRTLNVEEFTLWLDPEKKMVRRVSVTPHRVREYHSIAWTFSDVEYREVPSAFQEPVDREVLAGNGTLKSIYAGYTLEDERGTIAAESTESPQSN